ncbi:MAG TPA: PilZ domain-containing protein [Holophaga sp.]|jgi:hypothetical protein|nr:PilZ domain-containing protein [Holophaga sp.]
MNIPSEPRIFTRLPIGRQAIVLLEGQEPFGAEIINLSMSGVLLKSDHAPEEESDCTVSIPLSDGGELRIDTQGVIIRHTPDGFAVQFTKLEGLDSYNHLKNLLMYNAQTPENLEDELRGHSGIK